MVDDLTGLVGPLSMRSLVPQQDAVRVAIPHHVVGHQAEEGFDVALLRSSTALCSFEMSPGVIAQWSYAGARASTEQCDEPGPRSDGNRRHARFRRVRGLSTAPFPVTLVTLNCLSDARCCPLVSVGVRWCRSIRRASKAGPCGVNDMRVLLVVHVVVGGSR